MQLINVMDKEGQTHESVLTPSPVLPRLDRLDRLLQLLEEKHSLSGRQPSNNHVVVQKEVIKQQQQQQDDQCKTLSSALEEVQHKGTLTERLQMLENRVLQLSLEMDEGNTSKSSSSTVQITEKLDPGSDKKESKDEMMINEVMIVPGRENHVAVIDQDSNTSSAAEKFGSKNERRQIKKEHKKWIGWFHLGCN